MKKFCVLVIVLGCLFSAFYAQNGGIANHWHFGHNAGLDFSAGSPVAVSSPIYTQEGVATISDINGNLLFSTDGMSVYNRNMLQMPNGFGLLGNPSATQSSIIVPNPANANQLYIFTAAQALDFAGIQYSMVDMSLDGGLGDIITKNIPLLLPAAEKITAIKHCNNESYWVICHKWESDAFYAYEISNTGIQPPVISHVGSVYQGIYLNAVGYLKSSSNGKRLAAAIYGVDSSNVEIFDFNDATGTISNPTYIPTLEGAYGVSFSPDNTKLYVSFISSYTLVQYDLLAADIAASAYLLGDSTAFRAIQLAPDGKLYIAIAANHLYLARIEYPNLLGAACGYVQTGIALFPSVSTSGLPNFSDNFLTKHITSITLCTQTTTLNAGEGWSSYLWSTGDTTQSIEVSEIGEYWVELMTNCGTIKRDTFQVVASIDTLPLTLAIGNDTLICKGDSLNLDAGSGASAYLWSTGETTQSITVSKEGTYWVQKMTNCQCLRDSISLGFFPFSATLAANPITCHNGSTTLTVLAAGGTAPYQYALNNNPFQPNHQFEINAGTYMIAVQDAKGCNVAQDTFAIQNPMPLMLSAEVGTLCYGKTTHLTSMASGGTGIKAYSLNRSDYQLENTFEVGAGSYILSVKDANDCKQSTKIEVIPALPIQIQTSIDSIYCNETTGQITAFASGGSGIFTYTWLTTPPQYQDTLKDAISGTYHLQVTDSHNCTEEISVYIPHSSRPTAQYTSSPKHDFEAIYEGDSIHFFPQTLGADSYFWDFGDGTFSTEAQPVHVFETIGTYLVTLTVYDKDKICPDTYALLYKIVVNCNRLYIPNVFTPNGDGKNDFFKFVGTQSTFEATLFDRWGRVITQFDSIDDSWNGENAPEGVYAYKLKVVCEMGIVLYKGGTFTLIR